MWPFAPQLGNLCFFPSVKLDQAHATASCPLLKHSYGLPRPDCVPAIKGTKASLRQVELGQSDST